MVGDLGSLVPGQGSPEVGGQEANAGEELFRHSLGVVAVDEVDRDEEPTRPFDEGPDRPKGGLYELIEVSLPAMPSIGRPSGHQQSPVP